MDNGLYIDAKLGVSTISYSTIFGFGVRCLFPEAQLEGYTVENKCDCTQQTVRLVLNQKELSGVILGSQYHDHPCLDLRNV